MEKENWVSGRAIAEAERKHRLEVFDQFVDLALDGVITLEQALIGYKEETEPDDAHA